jgi:RNA polymerase sigma-70 factor (ECF subfamily)
MKQTENNLSEAEVIEQAKAGGAAAFEYLYKTHSKHVYRLCLGMVKNAAEAEDLTQQAFLQLFRKIGTFRGESGFATWLHRVTVNLVLMHLRRKKPTETQVEELEPQSVDGEIHRELGGEDPSMAGAIDRLNLARAIGQLPAGYKKFFWLHDIVGFGHQEIAKLMGCSLGCSKSQLHRARKRLRGLLQGEPGSERRVSPA